MTTPDQTAYLTPAEVARQLGVRASTVYRWMQAGNMRHVRIGSRYRTTQADVDQFVRRCTHQAPAPKKPKPTNHAERHAEAMEELTAAGLTHDGA